MKKFQEQYIINEMGQKTAVVIPIKEYEELIEDIHDITIITERQDESAITLEEIKYKLKKDGFF
ncbi:MAG: hypothetical protein HF967_03030 [Methanosarcinales archaeon]|jgi:PHD/YefM family antitoxin component YafN of YafNO toxin-antitoxin module|nr:hypothetical protein [Methanosarcinales archaeon]